MSEKYTDGKIMVEFKTGKPGERTWVTSVEDFVAMVEIKDDFLDFDSKVKSRSYLATVQKCVIPPAIPTMLRRRFGTFEHAEHWATKWAAKLNGNAQSTLD